MTMSIAQQVIMIAMIVLGTVITRFLPFLVFPANKPTPKYVKYLGKVLPPAVLGLLVIYCLREVNLFTGNNGIPELVSVAVVTLLHFWRKNMFLSIAGGTIVYMLLVQVIFY